MQEVLEKYRELINEGLKRNLPESHYGGAEIVKGMEYALMIGGKRVRPIFTLIGAQIGGLEVEDALTFACGVEYIHTYSLVHDDLPAMDNDSLRRGKPTTHLVFGEGNAILIGDALLTEGMALLVGDMSKICNKKIINSARRLIKSVGVNGMIGGQASDIAEKNDGDLLDYIHENKTASLLTNSLVCGALLGSVEPEVIEDLETYGKFFGLAFQITDDILDVEGNTESLGKNIGSDAHNQTLTYPGKYGLEKSKKMAMEAVELAKEAVVDYGALGSELISIADYLLQRKN